MDAPRIVTCPEWGARKPTHPLTMTTTAPDKIVIHATAGHGPGGSRLLEEQLPHLTPPQVEAAAYARMLQDDMMDRRGWSDSGHNFLVMRSGVIIQGRWNTVFQIERGRMVISAHCPGENDNPGVEHEHVGSEQLTAAQAEASCHLLAWICSLTGVRPTRLYPHSQFYPTSCPGNLAAVVPWLRLRTSQLLTASRQ